jgi:hypothetical protein
MREGWIKDYRQETESDIWMMPPLYLRVWQFLKYAACFEEKCIPMRDGSFVKLKPGQHLTSIRIIADKVSWFERGINRCPNPKTITDILEWMFKQEMISIDNGNDKRQYTLVTIVNWDKYQGGIETYGNNGIIDEKQELDIKNNYNN